MKPKSIGNEPYIGKFISEAGQELPWFLLTMKFKTI